MKIGSEAWVREEAFAEWIEGVEEDHAGCTVLPTCDGCDVWKGDEFVISYTFTVPDEKERA